MLATTFSCPFCGSLILPKHGTCPCGHYFLHSTASGLAFLTISGLVLRWNGTWAILDAPPVPR